MYGGTYVSGLLTLGLYTPTVVQDPKSKPREKKEVQLYGQWLKNMVARV